MTIEAVENTDSDSTLRELILRSAVRTRPGTALGLDHRASEDNRCPATSLFRGARDEWFGRVHCQRTEP